MAENIWVSAIRIFIYGFGTVCTSLIILMFCIKLMSAAILRLKGSEKNG
ncbi:MAG: OadG family protein [Proteobacteria bacterium]|nr:OadG family protein [Pseudomonadota bacterium]